MIHAEQSSAKNTDMANLKPPCAPAKLAHPQSIFPEPSEIPEQFRIEAPLIQREYLVNGEIKHWTGPMETVRSPICVRGSGTDSGTAKPVIVGEYPLLTEKEALLALDAAANAFDGGLGPWPSMPSKGRIACMQRFVEGMREKRDLVVKLIMYEIGKTLTDATKEFDRTVKYIEESIEALRDLNTKESMLISKDGIEARQGRMPLGVTVCVAPFNYPLNETYTTLIPALLMGNTVVFKPPKLGVLLHHPLLEVFKDAFPAGVVNTVYGDGKEVLTPLMKSGRTDVFAFIGSTRVAEILLDAHPANHRLISILGLGAKNPAILLKDADLDRTVKEVLAGALSYNGQRCTALKTIFIHRSIADEFVAKFSSAVSELKAGMPWEPGVQITPLPEEGKPQYLAGLVQDAVTKGAAVVNERGGLIDHTVFYPAVVYPVAPGMQLYEVEQFGPIVPIVPFDDVEEVVQYVKNSPYRQQASIFGTDQGPLRALSQRLALLVPRLNFNTQCQRGPDNLPFTGKKDSALGTLSIVDALLTMSLPQLRAAKQGGLPAGV